MKIIVGDIMNDTEVEMSFRDAMKRFGLSYENAKYYSQTGQIFDGRWYLLGMGGNPIPPDDMWIRR